MDEQKMTEEIQKLVDAAVKQGVKYEDAMEMSIESLQAEYGEKEPPETEESSLMKVSLEAIQKLGVAALKKHCADHGMDKSGKRPELLDKVLAIRFGRTRMYVGAETRCSVCGKEVSVKGTRKEAMGNGKTLVTRTVKCRGRHGHTYPLKNIV